MPEHQPLAARSSCFLDDTLPSFAMSFANASPLINRLEVRQAERLVVKWLQRRVQTEEDEPAVGAHRLQGLKLRGGCWFAEQEFRLCLTEVADDYVSLMWR